VLVSLTFVSINTLGSSTSDWDLIPSIVVYPMKFMASALCYSYPNVTIGPKNKEEIGTITSKKDNWFKENKKKKRQRVSQG